MCFTFRAVGTEVTWPHGLFLLEDSHVGVDLVDVLRQHLGVPNVILVDVLHRGHNSGCNIGHLHISGGELLRLHGLFLLELLILLQLLERRPLRLPLETGAQRLLRRRGDGLALLEALQRRGTLLLRQPGGLLDEVLDGPRGGGLAPLLVDGDVAEGAPDPQLGGGRAGLDRPLSGKHVLGVLGVDRRRPELPDVGGHCAGGF